jgi:NAD(P) transhydrogenase
MLDMPILTTVGALIGCSGAALTKIMCDAMNRDITSVILGGYGTKATGTGEAIQFEGETTMTNVDDTVKLLAESQSIIVVPGYGLAVAHAQYPLKEMADTLVKAGKSVRFAIHPVAGRMPGQLNVGDGDFQKLIKVIYDERLTHPLLSFLSLGIVGGSRSSV